tara:strand:+ start:62076 stop:62390 length:315 start_codon:yes stop_codon:yes gene_type:complete
MRITESQLRRVIRDVIREQQEQNIEEGPREFAIGAAALAALAIFGIVGRKAPANPEVAITQAVELVQDDPGTKAQAESLGVDVNSLVNQGMGMGADLVGMGMAD